MRSLRKMTGYLRDNLSQGFRASPFRAPLKTWALVPMFVVLSLSVGFATNLLQVDPLDSTFALLLPVTLFVFPSLLEEAFFRGILIPRNVLQSGIRKAVRAGAISTVVYVVWHPVNAMAFNHSAIQLFLNPWFLVIVCALGVTCSYSYIISRSIWVPIIIHWATVTVWVLFLGGRNLVLEL